jgi:hypothetical protein
LSHGGKSFRIGLKTRGFRAASKWPSCAQNDNAPPRGRPVRALGYRLKLSIETGQHSERMIAPRKLEELRIDIMLSAKRSKFTMNLGTICALALTRSRARLRREPGAALDAR